MPTSGFEHCLTRGNKCLHAATGHMHVSACMIEREGGQAGERAGTSLVPFLLLTTCKVCSIPAVSLLLETNRSRGCWEQGHANCRQKHTGLTVFSGRTGRAGASEAAFCQVGPVVHSSVLTVWPGSKKASPKVHPARCQSVTFFLFF